MIMKIPSRVGPSRLMPSTFAQLHRKHNCVLPFTSLKAASVSDAIDMKAPEKDLFKAYFDRVTQSKAVREISLQELVDYDDIRNLLNDGFVNMEDIKDLWISSTGEASGLTMDEAYEFACMVADLPDPEDMAFFRKEYKKLTKDSKGVSFIQLLQWKDIQDMIKENVLTMEDINTLWRKVGKDLNVSLSEKDFVRLNIFIDELIEEREMDDVASEIDPEAIDVWSPSFKAETAFEKDALSEIELFWKVNAPNSYLSRSSFFAWQDMKDLIAEGDVTQTELNKAWDEARAAMKEKVDDSISYDTFLRLNVRIDLILDEKEALNEKDTDIKKNGAIPSALVSEAARPLPQQKELTIGSLGQDSNDNEDLSSEELELMTAMDKADSLLNAGSFQDFDELIGDTDDPRLLNAKEMKAVSVEISKELRDILSSLYGLAKQQQRSGLVPPEEDVESRIRDLATAVLEKAPKAAMRNLVDIREQLVGKWRLVYSNSEMYRFYNGITGFANVFPGTSFQELYLEYSSDGYLNEAKYLETLKSPLGPTLATVYSNWDLMKETSFITNENSVMLRGYCTKVTAGPMEYRAEENWKSLRTLAMNEVIYVDKDYLIMRNAGALRVFFILERAN